MSKNPIFLRLKLISVLAILIPCPSPCSADSGSSRNLIPIYKAEKTAMKNTFAFKADESSSDKTNHDDLSESRTWKGKSGDIENLRQEHKTLQKCGKVVCLSLGDVNNNYLDNAQAKFEQVSSAVGLCLFPVLYKALHADDVLDPTL